MILEGLLILKIVEHSSCDDELVIDPSNTLNLRNLERLGFLKLLLEDEILALDCDLSMLVSFTPAYTVSYLKNLCITAAMLCLREHQQYPITKEFPTRRILEKMHFIKAMKTIRADPIDKQESARLRAFENRTI